MLEIAREKGNAIEEPLVSSVSSAGLPYCMHGNRVYASEMVSLTFFLSTAITIAFLFASRRGRNSSVRSAIGFFIHSRTLADHFLSRQTGRDVAADRSEAKRGFDSQDEDRGFNYTIEMFLFTGRKDRIRLAVTGGRGCSEKLPGRS